jgi:hypothetical protein
MDIKDLLDRFELLYRGNQRLADLRRSYTDKDLSSIFRLVEDEELRKAVMEKNLHSIFRLLGNSPVIANNIDDVRKAVMEQNLHSIFRMIDNDDLRKAVVEQNLHSIFRLVDSPELKKLVMDDNIWSLWKLLGEEVSTNFVPALKYFASNDITVDDDCFSRGQLRSKLWLIKELNELDLELGTVFLCAGWYATLATMMFENDLRITKIRSFDIDSSCEAIAERFNKPWEMAEWKFKAVTKNILDIDYTRDTYLVNKPDGTFCDLTDTPDTIINTSCEHIENFSAWYTKIPSGKLVILQTNNYFEIEDHVNCSQDLAAFEAQTPMLNCLYSGELTLDKYTRYMRIGYR